MKKVIALILSVLAFSCLAACSKDTAKSDDSSADQKDQKTDDSKCKTPSDTIVLPGNSKTLVIYFSRSGNTRKVAEAIMAQTGADTLRVVPSNDYSGYDTAIRLAKSEISAIDGSGEYPEVKTVVKDFSAYDFIFICTPLWWSRMSTPMQSFLHKHSGKLAGKKLALAVTSASSSISSVVSDWKRLCPGSTLTEDALWVTNSQTLEAGTKVASWLSSIGYSSAMKNSIKLTVGSKTFSAELEDNETAKAFAALLPLSLDMSELNGNEKYCYLKSELPASVSNPGTIKAGDIMLYGSNCIVLFYKTFNTSYSYTRIGKLSDVSGLTEALGTGGITIDWTRQ